MIMDYDYLEVWYISPYLTQHTVKVGALNQVKVLLPALRDLHYRLCGDGFEGGLYAVQGSTRTEWRSLEGYDIWTYIEKS